MPKKRTAVANLPDLPEHARREIEADPGQLDWWLRWAAVGDAKDAHAQARAEWVEASVQYRECYRAASAKAGKALPRNNCGCGECAVPVLVAQEKVQTTAEAIKEAERAFKEQT